MTALSRPMVRQHGKVLRQLLGGPVARLLRFCLGPLAVASVLASCGPSVQFIYEGNIRFEHCYRLDLDEHIAASHRKACWEDWLLRYPRAQTRDRLEYAKRRIDSLAAGDRATLSLRLPEPSEPASVAATPVSAPLPTNVHASPPARMVPTAPSGTAAP